MKVEINKRLSKKIVFDPEVNLDRICWVLDTFCPVCGEPLEVIFDELPCEREIVEAEKMPCEDCALDDEDEARLEDILGYMLEDDHSDHKN
jgi:hypothetical protein